MKFLVASSVIVVLAVGMIGCGIGGAPPQPLKAEAFLRDHPGLEPGVVSRPVDENGTLVYGNLSAPPLLPEEHDNPNPHVPTVISPQIRHAIPGSQPAQVAEAPVIAPSSAPAAPLNASLPNTYEVVGTVIAVVNGNPIYADKVVGSIQAALAADARRLDPLTFRQDAAQKIGERVQKLVADYVEVAAATEVLSPEDKMQADQYAGMIRSQLIAAAGGSLEMAKLRAAESGTTFDEQIKDKRDETLVRLYYQRFVLPRIQVTAADMRSYYQQNLATKFSQAAAAKFRLIKIDVARSGGPEQALAKAREIVRQLQGGADFAKLAGQYNDNAAIMKQGGDVGWIRKGDYFNDDIEKAVWKLQPGEFTEVPIEVRTGQDSAFYIAYLEAIRKGTVQPFDSNEVQSRIYNDLFDAQFRVLRDKRQKDLEDRAVIFREPGGMEAAVEIAMQRYPQWASAR